MLTAKNPSLKSGYPASVSGQQEASHLSSCWWPHSFRGTLLASLSGTFGPGATHLCSPLGHCQRLGRLSMTTQPPSPRRTQQALAWRCPSPQTCRGSLLPMVTLHLATRPSGSSLETRDLCRQTAPSRPGARGLHSPLPPPNPLSPAPETWEPHRRGSGWARGWSV